MSRRDDRVISPEELSARATALEEALASGNGQLDAATRERARAVIGKVRERTALVGGHTVVALAGATGSGKSTLFNAIVADEVAVTGVRRPTTSKASAAIWGDEPAGDLLSWLGVGGRHHVPRPRHGKDRLDGLVLLDLPDFDSTEAANRAEAERVLELVDVFCWVTDPQKYADARLHDDYVRQLASHEAVMLVVLNQADRLPEEARADCVADLRRLLERDGIHDATVICTSATTGLGIEELKQRLTSAVTGQNASRQRLGADIQAVASHLRRDVADREAKITEETGRDLVEALARSAGVPTVVQAVQRDFERETLARTGWPFTRWARAASPDPLKRLRLDRDGDPGVSPADVRAVLGRSSLPPPTPAARAAVDLATRQLGDRAAEGLPDRWGEAVHDAASPPGDEMADTLDRAIIGTSLRGRNPIWWPILGFLQVFFAVCAVVGFLWLTVMFVMDWMQLPAIDAPDWHGVPVPLMLLVLGLLLGLLLALVGRLMGRAGAQRRGHSVERRLHRSIDAVAREHVVGPVRDVLDRHAATRTSLERARGVR